MEALTSAARCFVHTRHQVMALKDEMIKIKSFHRLSHSHTHEETGAKLRKYKVCSSK